MKSFLTLGFLLSAIILFPGCYTIVFMEPTDEDVSFSPGPITPYDPGPWPCLSCVPVPPPCPPPRPTPVYVIDNPPSTPSSSDDRRPIQTGRGPIDSNPAPARNDENNSGTRDSGVRRGGR